MFSLPARAEQARASEARDRRVSRLKLAGSPMEMAAMERYMNVLQSNLLFGDPKPRFELGVGSRPSCYGGSFLLIDFCDPTAEFVGAM